MGYYCYCSCVVHTGEGYGESLTYCCDTFSVMKKFPDCEFQKFATVNCHFCINAVLLLVKVDLRNCISNDKK